MHTSTLKRLIPLLLSLSARGLTTTPIPPSQRGVPVSTLPTPGNATTDAQGIADTARVVDQKGGVDASARPDLPVAKTGVTAVDGRVVAGAGNETVVSVPRAVERRAAAKGNAYMQVFEGVLDGRDAAVEGTAYLTYTLVSNATYNVDDCLAFCDRVPGCVFVNLYYELNNPLLDFMFAEHSNLKCAAFGDVHLASEKTNYGGQKLAAEPTYVVRSGGWALDVHPIGIAEPRAPEGYELVFGPTDGANNAPGYMGFVFLDRYDVDACAALCSARDADKEGGACRYFNIWRALVDGVPTTYTCAFYYLVTDESTAVNYGQGSLKVTNSRGYRRTSLALDGGFESYDCTTSPFSSSSADFCYCSLTPSWSGTSPRGGTLDAAVFHYAPYARTGASVGLLGSASGVDAMSGTLSPKAPLKTVAGKKYVVGFWANTLYAGAEAERGACVDVLWNGEAVRSVALGYRGWTYYETVAVARGNDKLALHGGAAPAWVFIDDVFVFAL